MGQAQAPRARTIQARAEPGGNRERHRRWVRNWLAGLGWGWARWCRLGTGLGQTKEHSTCTIQRPVWKVFPTPGSSSGTEVCPQRGRRSKPTNADRGLLDTAQEPGIHFSVLISPWPMDMPFPSLLPVPSSNTSNYLSAKMDSFFQTKYKSTVKR